jgi:hypothetical protein
MMLNRVSFGSLVFLLANVLLSLSGACTRQSAGSPESYHPIEKYLSEEIDSLYLSDGKKVLFVIPVHGCQSCLDMIKQYAYTNEDPDVKFIYSVEHKRLVDLDILKLSRKRSDAVFMDFENSAFRKGLVSDSPVVYFLSSGLMVDSVQLTPSIFAETINKVGTYLSH